MELRQLVYFDAVACHGGFTHAANALHVAQPAISAQIRRLETELGVTLLTRTTRRVALTEAGTVLLEHARAALAELDSARADLSALALVLRGRIRLGAVEALDPFDLPAALATFHTRYPAIDLNLRSRAQGHELLADLDAGAIDLALAPTPTDLPERFHSRPLFSEELVLITAPDHPLARRPSISLGELRDESFIGFPPGSGLRGILEAATAPAGYTPHVPFESTSLTRIRELVSHRLGVALLARSVARAAGPPVNLHSLHPAPLYRPIGLLTHRDQQLSPAAEACHQLLVAWPGPDSRQ